MKSSNDSIRQSLEPQGDQRQQFLVFALRLVDALRDFWWVVLVLWGIFSYTNNIQYSVTELQAKYSGLENSVSEIRRSQDDIQGSVGELRTLLSPLQKDIENTKDGLSEVKSGMVDIQKDIKTLLAR